MWKLLSFKTSSTDRNKWQKKLQKGKTIKINTVVSTRAATRGDDASYRNGNVEIYDFEQPEQNNFKLDQKTTLSQVKSTAVDKVRYEPDKNKLYLTFVGGNKEYVYDVSPEEFEEFLKSGSKGRYVNYVLKENNRAPDSWY